MKAEHTIASYNCRDFTKKIATVYIIQNMCCIFDSSFAGLYSSDRVYGGPFVQAATCPINHYMSQ
jgi:hypothetical protein